MLTLCGVRRKCLFVVLAGFLSLTSGATGSEVWIVGLGTSPIHYSGLPDCESLAWRDKQYFFNSNGTAATVRLLDISNVAANPLVQEFTIPPNSLSSITAVDTLPLNACQFSCPPTVFAAHLDVPSGVSISSRAEILALGFECPAGIVPRVLAGLTLPVKRSLISAGVPQYHLGIDTGTDADAVDSAFAASSRTSVGVYNDGSVAANGTVEIRRGCDDVVIERRAVTIPAKSLIQFGGFASDTSGCGSSQGKAPSYALYAVVLVDQPSFSYAISLRNDTPPTFVGTSPMTQ